MGCHRGPIAFVPLPDKGRPVEVGDMNEKDILAYARTLAEDLTKDMRWQVGDYGIGGWWKADAAEKTGVIRSRAVAAMEFLRQYAGGDSHWSQRSVQHFESHGDSQSMESGARGISDLLLAWCEQVEAGITEIAGSRAREEVGIASTDLITQAHRLLEDKNAHPAAAIVLCGAALEIALRSLVEDRGIDLGSERPSMMAYARALRRAELVSAQDVKDFETCAGLRNSAAHGQFDALSIERAGLMEQQSGLLLRRLSDLLVVGHEDATSGT